MKLDSIEVTIDASYLEGDVWIHDSIGLVAEAAPIPEPSIILLLASGLIGLAGLRNKFRRG